MLDVASLNGGQKLFLGEARQLEWCSRFGSNEVVKCSEYMRGGLVKRNYQKQCVNGKIRLNLFCDKLLGLCVCVFNRGGWRHDTAAGRGVDVRAFHRRFAPRWHTPWCKARGAQRERRTRSLKAQQPQENV